MATDYLIAIDPGIRGTGVACFHRGALYAAYVNRSGSIDAACGMIARDVRMLPAEQTTVVVEIPQVYAAAKQQGDPNDLISIAAVAGAALGAAGARIIARPQTWKGQAPKAVIHDRARAVLEGREIDIWDGLIRNHGKTISHNGLDAIALGLWALGRRPK